MDFDPQSIVNGLIALIIAVYNSTFFSVLEFLIGIYAAVVFADIVLLLIQRGLGGDIRDTLVGMDIPPELVTEKKKGLVKKWQGIRSRLDSENASQYKLAIIEADNVIDDLLRRMKYAGENLGERIDNIPPGQIDHLEELREAHAVRNRIIHDDSLELTRDKADETLKLYEKFLELFEVL